MKAKIYRIHCNITGEDYYGSTRGTCAARLIQHEDAKNKCRSRHIIARGDYSISCVEKLYGVDNAAILDREAWWIKNNKCINRNIPRQSLYCDKCKCRIRDSAAHERDPRHKNRDNRTTAELLEDIARKLDRLALNTVAADELITSILEDTATAADKAILELN